eukprot:GHVT01100863.1.p1 GENE.GHVT01100863.1~~GHVT01100863.1.p1  ORF type:complete len:439 (-),score=140.03 GHVT01100863.1:468-1784(-)
MDEFSVFLPCWPRPPRVRPSSRLPLPAFCPSPAAPGFRLPSPPAASAKSRHVEFSSLERGGKEAERTAAATLQQQRQCVRQLMLEQQQEEMSAKNQMQRQLLDQENEARAAARPLVSSLQHAHATASEHDIAAERFFRLLRLDQDRLIRNLRLEFDAKAKASIQKANLHSKELRSRLEKQRKDRVAQVEDEHTKGICRAQELHVENLSKMKNYFSNATLRHMNLIKKLKEQREKARKVEAVEVRQLVEVMQQTRQLAEPLQFARASVGELEEEVRVFERTKKKKLSALKSSIVDQEEKLESLQLRNEVLRQKTDALEQQRKQFADKFQSAVYDLQQKQALNSLLIEKKVESLEEHIEVIDAQVEHVQSMGGPDAQQFPNSSSQKVGVLLEKEQSIEELKSQLGTVKNLSSVAFEDFAGVMKANRIPMEEVGVQPHTLK